MAEHVDAPTGEDAEIKRFASTMDEQAIEDKFDDLALPMIGKKANSRTGWKKQIQRNIGYYWKWDRENLYFEVREEKTTR